MVRFNSIFRKIKVLALLPVLSLLGCTNQSLNLNSSFVTLSTLSLSPLNSGHPVAGSSSQVITWSVNSTKLASNPISIDYSLDGGATWTNIVSGIANTGSYTWSVPAAINVATAQVRVTAIMTSGANAVTATSNFVIDSTLPLVNLTSMNAGTFAGGTIQNITWTTSDAGGAGLATNPIKLEYTADNGTTWNTIVAATANSSPYVWTLPVIDSAQMKVRVTSSDAAGNSAAAVSAGSMTVDSTAPALSLTSLNSGSYRGGSTQNITWTTADAGAGLAVNPIKLEYSSDNGTTWNTIVAATANASPYAWILPVIDNTQVLVRISSTDTVGNTNTAVSSSAWTIDSQVPILSSVIINDGAIYAGTSTLAMKVGVSDNLSGSGTIQIRFAEANVGTGDCQTQYANSNWQAWTDNTTVLNFTIAATDGTKKICAWAKDAAGNVSTIATPSTGNIGVDANSIIYQVGNPPVITGFTAVRTAGGTVLTVGDPMTLTWSTTDVEGLDNNPVSFSYTTDNITWKDIVTGLDVSNIANITWMGGLAGNPTSGSGTYTTFNAPTSAYFRMKAAARDQAGNHSIVAMSPPFNTANLALNFSWTVYAGSKDRGVGGTGTSALLYGGVITTNEAVNPLNGDVYAVDYGFGVRKLDAKTGLVSTVIASGGTNLPSNGAIPASPTLNGMYGIGFDHAGRFYITAGNSNVYQLDFTNNTSKLYLTYGTLYDATATAANVSVNPYTSLAFDEDNSLYFTTRCIAEVVNGYYPVRIMKVTQLGSGDPGAMNMVAGNCALTVPSSGSAALSTALDAGASGNEYLALTVWNHGNTIYIGSYSNGYFKILGGTLYSTALVASPSRSDIYYNSTDGNLYYRASGGLLKSATPNLAGAGGETNVTLLAGATVSANCTDDGITATTACVKLNAITGGSSGQIYFTDGIAVNSASNYRVRYIDASGKIKTMFGTLPFIGDGKDKSLIRGSLAGIYYKQATEPNQAAFPAGLYFVENSGILFGYIDPATNVTSILWGDQDRLTGYTATGVTISKSIGMGSPYGGGNGFSLTFDSSGFPWMRNSLVVSKIDASNKVVALQTNNGLVWDTAATGTNPANFSLYVDGGWQNLALKNSGLFLIGGYFTMPTNDPVLKISLFDFGGSTVTEVMGGTTVHASSVPTANADVGAGLAVNAQLSAGCANSGACPIQYRADQDRLYYAEGAKLRYITTPDNTATSALVTQYTLGAGSFLNFIFSIDNTQVWYIRSNGFLYCHDISSGKAWCDDVTNYYPYSANLGAISRGPNQMTWKDSSTLLISTFNGDILQFTPPP